MNINLTLFGEMLTFGVLIFVTLKYIWPPLTKAMRERQEKISTGLAAAERAQQDLQIAQQDAIATMRETRRNAAELTREATRKAAGTIERAKEMANREKTRLMALARADLDREAVIAEMALQKNVADLVNSAVKKILQNKIDARIDRQIIEQFITDIETIE